MRTTLIVGNLSHRATERQLARFFSSFGTLVAVELPNDPETGQPLGFAFIDFPSEELTELAFKVFEGRELDGRVLHLRRVEGPEDRKTQIKLRSAELAADRSPKPGSES